MRRLTGSLQNYAWGSTTAIPEILGLEHDGQPYAELWLGAHPSAPAQVDGRSLRDVVLEEPSAVGAASVERFGPFLPFLMKILAAERALSLQAHPSREQAEAGYAREQAAGIARDAFDRSYKDDWPKPEVICALGPFEALCGFADPEVTAAHFDHLGVPELADLVAPLRTVGGAEGLRQVFVTCCQLPEDRHHLVDVVADAAWNTHWRVAGDRSFGLFCRTATELAAQYPRDPGVIAALLMNRIHLNAGEALYLPAGNMHAYLRGVGIEVMANSDNVLRGGLTPKHVDVAELARVVDFAPSTVELVSTVEEAPGVVRFETPAPEFALWKVDVDGQLSLPGDGRGRIILVVDGTVACDSLDLEQGESAWVTADETVTVSGRGRLFVAASGV